LCCEQAHVSYETEIEKKIEKPRKGQTKREKGAIEKPRKLNRKTEIYFKIKKKSLRGHVQPSSSKKFLELREYTRKPF